MLTAIETLIFAGALATTTWAILHELHTVAIRLPGGWAAYREAVDAQ